MKCLISSVAVGRAGQVAPMSAHLQRAEPEGWCHVLPRDPGSPSDALKITRTWRIAFGVPEKRICCSSISMTERRRGLICKKNPRKAFIHAAEEPPERVDEPDKKSRLSPISLKLASSPEDTRQYPGPLKSGSPGQRRAAQPLKKIQLFFTEHSH